MDSPDGSLSTLDSNATSQNAQESLSSQQKQPSEELCHSSHQQELACSGVTLPFNEAATSSSFPRDLHKIQPPLEYIDAGENLPNPACHGNFPESPGFIDSPPVFELNKDSCVFLQSPESTSCFRGSDSGRSNPESPSLNEKLIHDEVSEEIK